MKEYLGRTYKFKGSDKIRIVKQYSDNLVNLWTSEGWEKNDWRACKTIGKTAFLEGIEKGRIIEL